MGMCNKTSSILSVLFTSQRNAEGGRAMKPYYLPEPEPCPEWIVKIVFVAVMLLAPFIALYEAGKELVRIWRR
jgi:hypothetical protein